MKNSPEQDISGSLAKESRGLNSRPESGRDFRLSPEVEIEALIPEIENLYEKMQNRIWNEIGESGDKKRKDLLKKLSVNLAEEKNRIQRMIKISDSFNSRKDRFDVRFAPSRIANEMDHFANTLQDYLDKEWMPEKTIDKETEVLREQLKEDLAKAANVSTRNGNNKKNWTEDLSDNKDVRIKSIKARFPINEAFIKYENGFPVSDFEVRDVVVGNNQEDDRIIIVLDGKEKVLDLSEADYLLSIERYHKESKIKKRKPHKKWKEITEEEKDALRRRYEKVREVQTVFSEENFERYLEEFEHLSEEQVSKKRDFFEKVKKKCIKKVKDEMKGDDRDVDVQEIVNNFLAAGNIYSKLRKVTQKTKDKKTSMNFEKSLQTQKSTLETGQEENQTLQEQVDALMKENDALVDETAAVSNPEITKNLEKIAKLQEQKAEEERDVTDLQDEVRALWKKRGELQTAEKLDKDAFQENQKRLQRIQDILKNRGEEYRALVLEKEGSEAVEEGKKNTDTDMNEEEKFDREVQRRKEAGKRVSRDTDMFEEEKFEEEVARREQRDVVESESGMDELRKSMEDARAMYAKKHHQSTNAWTQLKSYFGNSASEQRKQDEEEMNVFKGNYRSAYEKYRNAKIAELEGVDGERTKEILAELKKLDVEESVALYDNRVAAKAEAMSGTLGEKAIKVIEWYKKQKTWKKIAASGVLLASGMAVSGGAAVGVLGGAALLKRVVGAGAAGMGATGLLEARAQKKEATANQEILASFAELSVEEQKMQLNSFDTTSFDLFDKTFNEKVRGRRKRVVVGIGAAAGILALGSAGKLLAAGSEGMEVPPANDETQGPKPAFTVRMNPDMTAVAMEQSVNSLAEDNPTLNGGEGADSSLGKGVVNRELLRNRAEEAFSAEFGDTAGAGDAEINTRESIMKNFGINADDYNRISTMNASQYVRHIENMIASENHSALDKHLILLAQQGVDFGEYTVGEVLEVRDVNTLGSVMDTKIDITNSSSEGVSGSIGEIKNLQLDRNGIGTLVIGDGESIESALASIFAANSDQLTEGGMGWDPNKYKSVQEWAGKRAHGIAQEYIKAHPGVNLDEIQSGTQLDVNMKNLGDIRIEEISRVTIVPEAEKIILETTPENVAIEPIETTPEIGVVEALNSREDIIAAFGMNQKEYEFFKSFPASEFVKQIRSISVDKQTPLQRFFIALSGKDEIDLEGKMVTDILETEILDQELAMAENKEAIFTDHSISVQEDKSVWTDPDSGRKIKVGGERVANVENSESRILSLLKEKKLIEGMRDVPGFKDAVKAQVTEVYGMPADNIARTKIGILEDNNPIVAKRVEELTERAIKHLGEVTGRPREVSSIGRYFQKILAEAAQKGKVKDIFPSSDFTV